MTIQSDDPKGHYAVLGLLPGADRAAIKRAYRERIKKVHPDRNGSERAREEFQRLVEAYRVLRDGVHRAEYDLTGAHALTEDSDDYPETPFACSSCGCVTAQPRYVVFHQVKSFLVWARRGRIQGIFCRDCADRAAARASTVTWILGWWSPLGPVLSLMALIRNLLGGSMPRDLNARLLIRQAGAFREMGELDMSTALALQAKSFAHRSVHRTQVDQLLDGHGGRRLKNRWSFWKSGVFTAQLLPLLALPLLAVGGYLIWSKPWEAPPAAQAGITVQPPNIGEIRHVAVDDLKLRQGGYDGAPLLALLDRFTTVQVIGSESAEWTQVRTPLGVEGWVQGRYLYAGSGNRFRQEWCRDNLGTKPVAGEVLSRRATGEHRLLIHNDGRQDAVVKLKTLSGHTVVSYYIPAAYHMAVGGIPEGTLRIEFATGSDYSRACGMFMEDMENGVMPFTVTFRHISTARAQSLSSLPEVTLIAHPDDPKHAQPLDADRFTADD